MPQPQFKSRYLPFYPLVFFVCMVFRNGGFSFSKTPLVLVYFLRFTLLEPLRWLELLFYEKRILNSKVNKAPIFVLGHWRSGTSYLQNLLCQDERFTSYSIYRFVLSDVFMITEKWLKPPLNFICKSLKIPYSFQRVPLDLNIPGEMEVAMCTLANRTSYTWGHIFPNYFNDHAQRWIHEPTANDTEKWIADYDYLIRKLSYYSGYKRVIVKSPGDTARIAQLHKKYPDAKFVYIDRDPVKVFYSNRYLWDAIQKENSLHHLSQQEIDLIIFENYSKLLKAFEEQKSVLHDNQLIEISYQELNANPIDKMQEIYRILQLGELPKENLQRFIKNSKGFTKGSYEKSPQLEEEVKSKWAFAFKRNAQE